MDASRYLYTFTRISEAKDDWACFRHGYWDEFLGHNGHLIYMKNAMDLDIWIKSAKYMIEYSAMEEAKVTIKFNKPV